MCDDGLQPRLEHEERGATDNSERAREVGRLSISSPAWFDQKPGFWRAVSESDAEETFSAAADAILSSPFAGVIS